MGRQPAYAPRNGRRDVLKLGSAALINERCLSLAQEKPGKAKASSCKASDKDKDSGAKLGGFYWRCTDDQANI